MTWKYFFILVPAEIYSPTVGTQKGTVTVSLKTRRWRRRASSPTDGVRPQSVAGHHGCSNRKNEFPVNGPSSNVFMPLVTVGVSGTAVQLVVVKSAFCWRVNPPVPLVDRKSTRLNSSHV